jgi:hypothetical protein
LVAQYRAFCLFWRFSLFKCCIFHRLETIEGKALAIDSSIWMYQFQATMRDKDGRALLNAHVLGFLRRICKLLFYGIRPVFVFDGGAPTLKRNTIVRHLCHLLISVLMRRCSPSVRRRRVVQQRPTPRLRRGCWRPT